MRDWENEYLFWQSFFAFSKLVRSNFFVFFLSLSLSLRARVCVRFLSGDMLEKFSRI